MDQQNSSIQGITIQGFGSQSFDYWEPVKGVIICFGADLGFVIGLMMAFSIEFYEHIQLCADMVDNVICP